MTKGTRSAGTSASAVTTSSQPGAVGGAGDTSSGRAVIFGTVSIALLMSSIDQTIVATALPALQRALDAPITWVGWTITVYSLGRALVLPLAGKLSDQYGRRTIFVTSVVVFTLASLCCGLATNIYLLVALRAIQAVGGAAFMPSATGIVVDHFGGGRDRAVALFTSIIPIGGLIGPILGGVFVTYWSWRGIFLVNVPIGAVLVVLGMRYIPRGTVSGDRHRLDVRGMLLLAAAVLAAMLGITYLGGSHTSVLDLQFLLPVLVAAVTTGLFLRHTARAEQPFIPHHLLRGRGFGVMNGINYVFGGVAIGLGALVPLYATQRFGIAALHSGTLLSARAVGMIAVSAGAAYALRRTGYRRPMVAGFIVVAGGLVALSVAPPVLSPYGWLTLGAALTGVGMGIAIPASNSASLQLAPADAGAIAGLRGTFRQAGSITAISVSTAILARSHNPGIALAEIFTACAVLLLCTLPLIGSVPEHRGSW